MPRREAETGLLNIQKIAFIVYDEQFDRDLWTRIGSVERMFRQSFGGGFKISDYDSNSMWVKANEIVMELEPE